MAFSDINYSLTGNIRLDPPEVMGPKEDSFVPILAGFARDKDDYLLLAEMLGLLPATERRKTA